MTTALDWEFIKEFHPLPPSDRRNLLKAMGVEGISQFDEEQFYSWLAERYRLGEGPQLDAAIHRKLNKADERGLTSALYSWLRRCTNSKPRRLPNMRPTITFLAKEVISQGGENADRLLLLAPNYPWLSVAEEDGIDTSVPLPEVPEDGPASNTTGEEASCEDRPPTDCDDSGVILDRLIAAIALLRERPNPDLVGSARVLADAIEAHEAQAAIDEAQLTQRRESLAKAFESLDPAILERVGTAATGQLELETVDRIDTALAAFHDANRAHSEARAEMVASLDNPSESERAAALDTFNASILARDAAIAALGESIISAQPKAAEADRFLEAARPILKPIAPLTKGETTQTPHLTPVNGEALETTVEPSVERSGKVETLDAATPAQDDIPVRTEVLPNPEKGSEGIDQSADGVALDDNGEAPFEPGIAVPAEPDAPDAPLASLRTWDSWINAAIGAGRLGLAVHLSDGQNLAGAALPESLSTSVIEGVLRGASVQSAYSRPWGEYDDLKASLLAAARISGPCQSQNHLLLFASAIRPAIVQSQTALALLGTLEGEIAAILQPLRAVLEDIAEERIDDFAQIAGTPDQAENEVRIAHLRKEIENWQENAPKRRMNYQPATAVWIELIGADGPLGSAAALVTEGEAGSEAKVAEIVDTLIKDSDDAIDTVREKLAKGVRREPIEGNARKHLHGQILAACELFSKWVAAERALTARDDRFHAQRDRLLDALVNARDEVAAIARSDSKLTVAADLFCSVLANVEGQLRGTIVSSATADETMDWEIALLPRFPLNSRVGFRITPDDVEDLVVAASEAIAPNVPSADEAFESAIALRALSSADRLLAHLSPTRAATARSILDAAVSDARIELVSRMQAMRQLLDDTQIATTEQSGKLDELEQAMTSFEQWQVNELPRDIGDAITVADFPTANRDLDRVQRMLDKVRTPLREALSRRISALEKRFGRPLDDCRAQLDCDDLGTLSEEVDQIERHGLAGQSEPAALDLLKQFSDLLRNLGDRPEIDWGNLARVIRDGGKRHELDFGELSSFERERATTLVQAFLDLRRAFSSPQRRGGKHGDSTEKLAKEAVKLLKAIGWPGVRIQDCRREQSWFRCSMSSVVLRSRDDCPVPAFGSERLRSSDNRSHYALVIVPPEETDATIGALDRLPDKVLLFFATALDSRQRRDVLRKSRRSTRSVAVADGLTIAMLASTPDLRLRHFFELAIPMGSAQPYADKGAETAVENFFGRQNEINQLVDPDGPSFVYGGRQLGKTALLKQIELRENDNEDRVAVFCDIKPIGESEPAGAVWDRIHDTLVERKIALPTRSGSIADQLKTWVEQKAGRFLLIMLDEADAFLASEMERNFPQIRLMKELMEQTRRSVKFVFAGLHNVQRFYRAPNSPLLHWGSPINVGPLLGTDRLAARQMALEPMAALGFKFARTTDAYHMLSLVGFYPSLMQSFGKAVVNELNRKLASKGDPVGFPAKITRDNIEACFKEQTFRDSVTYRFQETLKLDERYELITYAVWDRMQDDSHGGRATAFGYSASEISRMARTWWPAGFAETESLESFTAILDEMVEMGVLARKSDLYALRSQRIAAMLGDKTEIARRLANLIDSKPRRRPDPMLSHRRLGKSWSPLTLRQEAALHGQLDSANGPRIVLMSASKASGLSQLRPAIDVLLTSPAVGWRSPRQLANVSTAGILDAAAHVRRDASREVPGIIVVEGNWPNIEALQVMRKDRVLREAQRPVRLILCGVPTPAVLAELPEMPDVLHVQIGPLPEEAMLHWMNRERIGFADDPKVQRRLRDASGGFLDVLDRAKLDEEGRTASDALIAAVETSAASVGPDDLGLIGQTHVFARELANAVGTDRHSADDFRLWAVELAGKDGEEQLRALEALGVVETSAVAGNEQMQALNPLAARLLQ